MGRMVKQKQTKKEILVFADWIGVEGPKLIGKLYASRLRGKEIFEFEYAPEWLKNKHLFQLDPDLMLFPGRQYPPSGKPNFGLFLDSMPDRWGRQLMIRREALIARREGRRPNVLMDSDFLLGVFDKQRPGGLRYKIAGKQEFINSDRQLGVPPWANLRELEIACWQIEDDSWADDNDQIKWLALLLAPGSSLGGARPKAGVADRSGGLWIAKFPSRMDTVNVGAWEMVLNQIGLKARINMAGGKLVKLGGNHHTYLSKRFDRTNTGQRKHFASAMTLLQKSDGDDFSSGVGYLDMVAFIIRHGANPRGDLEELWRRMVFSILVSNTDDHLRNHGFLLTDAGWALSPAFDLNPNPAGVGLKLNVSAEDNSLDPELALSVSHFFRLELKQAKTVLKDLKKAVSSWRKVAESLGIEKNEIHFMERCFLGN